MLSFSSPGIPTTVIFPHCFTISAAVWIQSSGGATMASNFTTSTPRLRLSGFEPAFCILPLCTLITWSAPSFLFAAGKPHGLDPHPYSIRQPLRHRQILRPRRYSKPNGPGPTMATISCGPIFPCSKTPVVTIASGSQSLGRYAVHSLGLHGAEKSPASQEQSANAPSIPPPGDRLCAYSCIFPGTAHFAFPQSAYRFPTTRVARRKRVTLFPVFRTIPTNSCPIPPADNTENSSRQMWISQFHIRPPAVTSISTSSSFLTFGLRISQISRFPLPLKPSSTLS